MIDDLEPVEMFEAPIHLDYDFYASRTITPFLHAIREGRIVGGLSPATGKVLIPPLGADPESGCPTTELVELADTGTVLTFTTVHLPIPASSLKPPFTVANILLDGADQAISHLVADCDPADVRIGSRVQAVWRPREEWTYGLENICWFRLLDEPLVDIPALRERCLARAAARRAG